MADEERLSEVGELRHRLQSMELRLKRLRDQRDQHNDSAKRAAGQRDMVQEAYKELKERIDEGVEQLKQRTDGDRQSQADAHWQERAAKHARNAIFR